jgi:hypothetical protein
VTIVPVVEVPCVYGTVSLRHLPVKVSQPGLKFVEFCQYFRRHISYHWYFVIGDDGDSIRNVDTVGVKGSLRRAM